MNAQSGEHRQQSDHKSSDQEVSGRQATRQRQTLRALAHIHECGTVIGVGSRRRIIPGVVTITEYMPFIWFSSTRNRR